MNATIEITLFNEMPHFYSIGQLKKKPRFTFTHILQYTQPAFTCSKLTIETPAQGVKYVQS